MVKILHVDKINGEHLDKAERIPLVNQDLGANNFGIILLKIKEGAPAHVSYHFHKKKESAFFVLKGIAKMIVEEKEYIIKPDTLAFIPPGEKHQLINVGKKELKVIEVYSPPPLDKDNYNTSNQNQIYPSSA